VQLNAHVYLKTLSPFYMKTPLCSCKHELSHACSAHMQKLFSLGVLYASPLTRWIHMLFMTIKLILDLVNSMCKVTNIFLQINFCVLLKRVTLVYKVLHVRCSAVNRILNA
jgi:hypothetical protein